MRRRRAVVVFMGGVVVIILLVAAMPRLVRESFPSSFSDTSSSTETSSEFIEAKENLERLAVKGRAPKTGYERAQFGDGWSSINGCTTREIILYRDLRNVQMSDECTIELGTLDDPYTGKVIDFTKDAASAVQIDHVVALSDAWQKGAQNLSKEQRIQLANDPLELLAVDGPANQQKSDADAATWLPKNKSFRCEYVARQIAVKTKYSLWVTQAEGDTMRSVLKTCT